MQNYNAKTIKQTAIYQWFCLTKPSMDKYIEICADGNNAVIRLVRNGQARNGKVSTEHSKFLVAEEF
jgi:hypothetical protein